MIETENERTIGVWVASLVAIVFGLMTIREGGMVLFGPPEYAEAAGNYVPFVLWFNFIAGSFYIIAGVYIFMQNRAGAILAMIIAVMTVIVFGAFGVHVVFGGEFESRTVIAMSLRSLVWTAIAVFTYRTLKS